MVKRILLFYWCLIIMIRVAYSQVETLVAHSQIPLFQADSIINIDVHLDIETLVNDNGYNARYHDIQIIYNNYWSAKVTIDAQAKCRGRFRIKKENCNFPPLMIQFDKKDAKHTIFEGIEKAKLVTQCQHNQKKYESFLLREYLAYRIYNIITDYSYKVRLVKVKYIDNQKNNVITNLGFFIEPTENMILRLKGLNYTRNIHPNAVHPKYSAIFFLYQFLIGNTDWAIKNQHNVLLLETSPGAPPVPIPFDLDFSGLVNTPYAIPHQQLPISSVKERYYFGFCRSKEDTDNAIKEFILKKNSIYQLVNDLSLLSGKEKDEILNYFEQFYRIIESPKKVERELVKKCRTD